MILYIFDRDYNFIGFIDNYISLTWREEYQGRGEFQLTCVDTDVNIARLKQNYFVWKKGKKTAMVIRYVESSEEENTIIIRGYTTLDLLTQRYIYPTQTISNIEVGMRDLINHCFTSSEDRKVEDLSLADIEGFSYILDTQYTGKELLETLVTLATESGLGFFMQFDYENKRNIFTIYEGIDRTFGNEINDPAMFSAEFGNLQNVIILDDMTVYKNVAIVAGAGEGSARIVIEVGNAAGWDRNELFVDARDLQKESTDDEGNTTTISDAEYEANLISRGTEKLNEHIRAQSFTGDVDTQEFGVKYNLGDIVSCKSSRYGIRLDARITQYEEVIENNITTITPTFGDPEITFLKEVKLWL